MAAQGPSKQALRKQMKLVLNSMPPAVRLQKSKVITEKVKASDIYQNSNRIAVFLSMPDEVETKYLLADMFNEKKKCFIPRYDTNSRHMDMLELYSMQDLDTLPKTKWNIPQPEHDCGSRENALETGGVELMLMPGLAFTLQGHRLGRGKGYYDTYLEKHQSLVNRYPLTLALAFSEQVLEYVPTHEHDITIDQVALKEWVTLKYKLC